MTFTRIKICGITRAQDSEVASAAGADAIGLVFYAGSPRAVTISSAQQVTAAISPFVETVALFVDEPADSIKRILDCVPINLIQFHGEETPEFCEQFNRPWMKAVRVSPGLDIAQACSPYSGGRAVLLDSWKDGVPGGTGMAFDWQLAAHHGLSLPVVLAGGLHDGNVGEAIRLVQPAAVDVSGGVEQAPGIKDAQKIYRFIAAVRAADHQVDGHANDS